MTCPKCHRPLASHWACDIEECWPGEAACDVVAAAYRRGVLDGVALSNRELNINYGHWGGQLTHDLDWSDVEREAAKLAGEG